MGIRRKQNETDTNQNSLTIRLAETLLSNYIKKVGIVEFEKQLNEKTLPEHIRKIYLRKIKRTMY